MANIILFYIIWISISFTYHYAIAQDYKNLWNQCQRYNTIALETYKKCYGKLDVLTEKHEEIQANHNQTKLELISCQELGGFPIENIPAEIIDLMKCCYLNFTL